MFSGWVRYLKLTAKAKTGLSTGVVVFAIVAAIAIIIAVSFAIFSLFIWLAERYSPLTAALVLTGLFLLLAILAGIGSLIAHKRTIAQANLALQARSNSPWLDPKFLPVGLAVFRAIGLRRIAPLVAVGFLAAALAKEWFGDRQDEAEQAAEEERHEEEERREAAE
jgi:hypothetical protein